MRAKVLESLADDGKAVAIGSEYRANKDGKAWPWLADALAGIRPDGQLAMFGDAASNRAAKVPMSNADRQRAFRQRQRELKEQKGMQSVLLDEAERLLIEQLREHKRGVGHSQDPRPFLLSQRDRSYLTSALDYHEFMTYGKWKDEYPMTNMRELYVRLSVHEVYPQATDFPPAEKRQAWSHEQTRKALYSDYEKKIAALQKENGLLESERNKAHSAIKTWEDRLRAAGVSTDYRKQPGE